MRFSNKAISKTIRHNRKARGLSQDVLSGFAGIARSHLSMIETGEKQANFETLWKIAVALDMKPSQLVMQIEELAEIEEKNQNASESSKNADVQSQP